MLSTVRELALFTGLLQQSLAVAIEGAVLIQLGLAEVAVEAALALLLLLTGLSDLLLSVGMAGAADVVIGLAWDFQLDVDAI